MSEYQQPSLAGAIYCFTLVTYQRKPIFNNEENINILHTAFKKINTTKPFDTDALVILPDHLHCIWRLPENDQDYAGRWREIKKMVSRSINPTINYLRERPLWQRHVWEHLVHNEEGWRRYLDYIHYNPVKHGYAQTPADWPWSSFNIAVRKGWYESSWGATEPDGINNLDFE